MERRFIAIVHSWFVDSKGFDVITMDVNSKKEADREAAVIYREHNSDFRKAEVLVLELEKGEHSPRRLSLWERITGRIHPAVTE